MKGITVEALEQSIAILGAKIENDVLSLKKTAKTADKNEIARAVTVGLGKNILDKDKLPVLTSKEGQKLANDIHTVVSQLIQASLNYYMLEGKKLERKQEQDKEQTNG